MDLSATLILAGLILALLWFRGKKSHKLPPGPFALPLIGNLPQLEKKAPFKSFIEVSLGSRKGQMRFNILFIDSQNNYECMLIFGN